MGGMEKGRSGSLCGWRGGLWTWVFLAVVWLVGTVGGCVGLWGCVLNDG